jgi:hypothetical protein
MNTFAKNGNITVQLQEEMSMCSNKANVNVQLQEEM